jgi:hypothetical protein
MKQHQAVIYCKEKVVVLTTSKGQKISLDVAVQPPPTVTMNQLDDETNSQDHAVDELPYVFLDDFLGMPPDREIEFVIELLPSAAPIAKCPYKMGVNELEELKK